MSDLCPRCPICDSPPLFAWLVPYFCPDEECQVVCWDPNQSLDANINDLKTTKPLDLSGLEREQ